LEQRINKIVGFISAILTFAGSFHFYLNLSNENVVTYEDSIKILRRNFIAHPVQTPFLILIFIALSILTGILISKLIYYLNFQRRRRLEANKTIRDLKKRESMRELLFNRIINNGIPFADYSKKPWIRIQGEFHKIIVRDINDKKFPEIGDWFKLETFDLKNDGIEFFSRSNIIGFDLYYDEEYKWDAFHNKEEIKSGTYSKANKPYCIVFIPYENIVHVEWKRDDREDCITIFCPFIYKTHIKHPYKEIKYYVESHGNFLTMLEAADRRNFKSLSWQLKKPLRIIKRKIGLRS